MPEEKRLANNYFDGLPLAAPQIMMFLILMTAYFFQQYSNWNFNFLIMAILKSSDLIGQAGNVAMGRITSWYFVGMTAGGIAGGLASDLIGRRKTMLASLLLLSGASFLAGLTRNFEMLLIARTLTGFGIFSLMIVSHAYIAEMSPAESRGKWQCLVAAVGFSAAPASAFLSRATLPFSPDAWRYVLYFGGLGIVPFFLGLTYLKESPRWLIAKGRRKEAEELVEDLTGLRITLPDDAETPGIPEAKPGLSILGMFSRTHRGCALLLLVTFILQTPASFINAFWLPQLLSNFLKIEVAVQLMQFISWGIPLGCLLGAFVTEKGGRRLPLILVACLAAIASAAMSTTEAWYSLFLSGFFAQAFTMASSFILFAYAVEQFPTQFRNSAAGILNGFGRFAVSGLQPLVVVLASWDVRYVFLMVAGLFLVSVPPLLLWGRKTAGKPLELTAKGNGA